MMHIRVMVGVPLAIAVLAALALDGYLAAHATDFTFLVYGVDFGPWLANGLICTLASVCVTLPSVHELVLLARARGYRPFGWTAQLFSIILVAGPYVSYNWRTLTGVPYDESWGLLWMAFALGFTFMLQAIRHRTANAMENLATTVFIIYYVGGLAGFCTKLRMEVGGSTGVLLLVFSIFLIKMTDTGAYFAGTLLGRHPAVPWLSPKKTWEGYLGGFIVTLLCAVGVGHWLRFAGWLALRDAPVPFTVAMLLVGVALAIFSAAGDLCASLLKRDAAVKDSGAALPGLGGVLDVMDSVLLGAPVAWLFWTRIFHAMPT